MDRVLLIEDEENVATFIKKGLMDENYDVLIAHDGAAGLAILSSHNVDLIILDIILPDTNGLDLCLEIRQRLGFKTPIIMLTALSTTDKIVTGLDNGADDYLTKPFKLVELSARIRALLRRKDEINEQTEILTFDDLKLDLKTKKASRKGDKITLTATEFKLLEFFMKRPNEVLSRQELLEKVWGLSFDTKTNIVDVYVNYIRVKVDRGYTKKLIQTVVGMGYILKKED